LAIAWVAYQPVSIAMGTPEGEYAHWPACRTPGMGVRTDFGMSFKVLITGTSVSKDQPVIAPSELPDTSLMVSGVDENLKRISASMPL
jgi:hypothetical protein